MFTIDEPLRDGAVHNHPTANHLVADADWRQRTADIEKERCYYMRKEKRISHDQSSFC